MGRTGYCTGRPQLPLAGVSNNQGATLRSRTTRRSDQPAGNINEGGLNARRELTANRKDDLMCPQGRRQLPRRVATRKRPSHQRAGYRSFADPLRPVPAPPHRFRTNEYPVCRVGLVGDAEPNVFYSTSSAQPQDGDGASYLKNRNPVKRSAATLGRSPAVRPWNPLWLDMTRPQGPFGYGILGRLPRETS